MKKWKIPLMFLFSVILLVCLAFLPAVVGVLQDAGVENKLSHRPLHSIAPYISENGSGLRFSEKLAVLQESEVSAIVPALASMTEQQVRIAVEEGIQPYIEAGIIRNVEAWNFHATPWIAISLQDSYRYFLFWVVNLVDVSGDMKYSMTVHVDDETGKFLSVEYYDPYIIDNGPLWEEKCPQLEQFAQIWLEQAGLRNHARPMTAEGEGSQVQGEYSTVRTMAYQISDGLERPLYMAFGLASHGEYMMWFKSMPL